MASKKFSQKEVKQLVGLIISEDPKKKYAKTIKFNQPLTKYEKMRCSHFDNDGIRCTNNAVGSSTLCSVHGGNKFAPETMGKDVNSIQSSFSGKYDPTFHPTEAIKLAYRSYSDVQIAAEFEVSMNTVRAWEEKYIDFYEAMQIARTIYESQMLHVGVNNLSNTRFSTALYKFLTMNKLGYSDKVEQKAHNTNVVHGVLVTPGMIDQNEWLQQAEEYNRQIEEEDAKLLEMVENEKETFAD